jgi:TetR/AcrR family transcriptional regulator, regulator of biofilm formation and stress response
VFLGAMAYEVGVGDGADSGSTPPVARHRLCTSVHQIVYDCPHGPVDGLLRRGSQLKSRGNARRRAVRATGPKSRDLNAVSNPAAAIAQRRYDPGRRDRIIDACLDVIAETGVAGTSHRKVAEAADVPLGSMTYHFSGMHDLLHEAFSRYAEAASEQFESRIAVAADIDSAKQVIVDVISEDVPDPRDLVLTHELYTLAARDPAYRDITNAWMARSRRTLEQYFDRTTARILDALVEGLSLHRALDIEPHQKGTVVAAVERVTAASASR